MCGALTGNFYTNLGPRRYCSYFVPVSGRRLRDESKSGKENDRQRTANEFGQ